MANRCSSRGGALSCVGLALFLLAGCAGPGGTASEDASPEPGMYPHFFRVGLVQNALVHGRLEEAREPARWLAQRGGPSDLPRGSETWVEELRQAAARVADARGVAEASMAAGRMAGACGACHRRFDGGPDLVVPAAPESGQLPHIWAADRLWEGLIDPSDASWEVGARLLSTVAFTPSMEPPPGIADLVRQAHELGESALETDAPSQRAELYGTLLGTCAECHRRVGVTGR